MSEYFWKRIRQAKELLSELEMYFEPMKEYRQDSSSSYNMKIYQSSEGELINRIEEDLYNDHIQFASTPSTEVLNLFRRMHPKGSKNDINQKEKTAFVK